MWWRDGGVSRSPWKLRGGKGRRGVGIFFYFQQVLIDVMWRRHVLVTEAPTRCILA